MFEQTKSKASILSSDCHKLDLFINALQHTTLTVLLSFIVCLKLCRWRSRQNKNTNSVQCKDCSDCFFKAGFFHLIFPSQMLHKQPTLTTINIKHTYNLLNWEKPWSSIVDENLSFCCSCSAYPDIYAIVRKLTGFSPPQALIQLVRLIHQPHFLTAF